MAAVNVPEGARYTVEPLRPRPGYRTPGRVEPQRAGRLDFPLGMLLGVCSVLFGLLLGRLLVEVLLP